MNLSNLWNRKREYTAVPSDDSIVRSKEGRNEVHTPFPPSPTAGTGHTFARGLLSSTFLLVGCLLCVISNVWILSHFLELNSSLRQDAPLPRPNPFVNFANINRIVDSSIQLGPITTWPVLLAQINVADKHHIYIDGSARVSRLFGAVSPNHHTFRVGREIHTIAQFRARDFGMERCQVIINLPPSASVAYDTKHEVGANTDTVRVAMWRLTPTQAGLIDSQTLSWHSRPKRVDSTPIHIFSTGRGHLSESVLFLCPQDSIHTFEFECADVGCSLDFSQNISRADLGVYMKQHATG